MKGKKMLNNEKFKKNINSCFLIFLMTIFFITINQKIEAQLLYYPANAVSAYGTLSIFVPPPPPTGAGTLPYNILGGAPAVLVYPPAPVNIAASVAGTILSRVALTTLNPASVYNLYYPASAFSALGTASTFVAPPAPVGIGTFPFNLYYMSFG